MIGHDVAAILIGVPLTIALTLAAFAIGALLGLPLCALRFWRYEIVIIAWKPICWQEYCTRDAFRANLPLGRRGRPPIS